MGTPVLDTSTGRYYDAVLSKAITPADALTQAATLNHRGLSGYLATISSAAENQTILNVINPLPFTSYLFGASDVLVDTKWAWQSGPEKGAALVYTNWHPTEPNNYFGGVREDYVAISSDIGKWADLPATAYDGIGGYIVEYGGMPATYAITTSSATVIEGASVVFTIETANVEWGTNVSYAISGITAADLSTGSLTGTAVVNQVGTKSIATVTLPLADDKLAEGSETLTLTVAGVSQAVTVIDAGPVLDTSTGRYYDAVLSKAITPADALAQAATLSHRGLSGYLATINSAAENQTILNVIKPLPFTSYLFGASDVLVDTKWAWQSGPEKGAALVYTNWHPTEPNNYFGGVREDYVAISSDIGKWADLPATAYDGIGGYIVEYGGMPATYAVTTLSTSVTEGASVVFTIETTNVEWGKTVSYAISGITAADLSTGSLTGTAVVNQVGTKSIATVTLPLADDKLAEGSETLTLTVAGVSQAVTVIDAGPVLDTSTGRYYDAVLSKAITPADALAQAATLSHRGLSGYLATINSAAENQTILNVIKPLPFTSYLFGASDVLVDTKWAWQSGPEKGAALVYTNWHPTEPNNYFGGVREDYVAISSDIGKWADLPATAYDGIGGYIVEYGGMPAAYAISTPSATVIEGASVVFTIETANVEWGTNVSYAISGITAADLSAGSLTGTAVVNQVGTKNIASVTLTLADDKVTEGSETLTLTVAGVSQLVTVTDPASVSGDSGNTLATAKDLGNLTYNVAALGALQGQEFSETVGGDTDTADFFKFELTQANGMYLNLTSTVGTRFQVQNSAGTAVGTMSLGSSMGMAMGSSNYMINLEPGTYYLRVNTLDSAERAAYTVKTVLAPQDTQNDNLGVNTPAAQKLGALGMNASLTAQANLWSNYASGTSSSYNMMSGQNSNDAYSFTLSQDAKVKFDLSALKNASYINASISSSNGTPVGNLNLSGMMPATGTTGTTGGNPDQAIFEKELLAGTYNISVNGMGQSKYDYASGTSVYLPTQYQLTVSSSASAAVNNDSGNNLATAKDLGNLTYNVAALGALQGQEFGETVGGDTDTADFFKFELTQANGMYLNLTSTVGTRFQVQNSAGTPVGTMSLGSSMGPAMSGSNYMINLEPGTYYLRVNTIDSSDRAAYTVKTVLAPQDTQNDNLGVYTPTAQKLGSLGANASLKAQATLWSNYASGTSSSYNMMSGQNSNDAYSFTLSQDAKVKFDLSALKNASYINASISSSNGTPVGNLNLSGMMPATGTTGTTGGNPDQAIFEKELLAGTYNISVNGMGQSKYDYASGTSIYLPTQYQLTVSSSASAAVNNDSGNNLATAKDLGNLTYNVAALGALQGQEFGETVGGDTDTADFFKFELTQANGMYLNLTSTVGTRFQVQNSAGTAVGTMSLGSSMGMAMGSSNYMINLEPGTYYLRVNTIDSAERAAYSVKTVLAPQDTQNDNLGVYTPTAQKLGSLGANASLKAQATLWSNYASGTSSSYNMMSGQNSNDAYSFTLSQDAKVKFDLSALKNASYINASISSSNGTPVGYLNLSTMMPATGTTGTTGTTGGNPDQAIFEKELLAGTYNISVNGMGQSKYDYASGTSVYLPTQYQLSVSTGAGGGADTTAPTLTVSSNKNSVQVGDTAVLSFAFSEKPTGFELADIAVSNGTVSELKVSANDSALYTANFSPVATASNGAAISVSVAAGSYQDAAGNLGTAFTLSSMKVVVPSYSVTASASTVDEGGTLSFTLNTQNLTPGAVVPYTLSGTGISSGDIDGGVLSGSLKIDASGKASLLVGLVADKLTEGAETLSFTAGEQSTSVSVKDTSTAASTATPGVLFTEATNLKTTEAGGKAQFKVSLASAPRYDVKLTLTSNDTSEGLFVLSASTGAQTTAATQTLTFTPANWNQAQTVNLIGVDDAETDGNVAYSVSSKIASDDLNYDGMRAGQGIVVANLIAENIDDDNPDEVSGTPGNDVLYGGPGPSDIYGFLGRDEIYGGKGDDRLYSGYGDDVLLGEDGNDSLEGEQGSDKLLGGSGKDSLSGGSGNDSLFGGDGDDVLDGQDGADAMDGGKGADTYYVDNPGDTVTDSGADGALDTVYIAAYLGKTYEMGKGLVNATLSALAGPGGLAGNASDNKLEGNTQNNTLSGGQGSDTIAGGGGNDSIDGGDGSDTVVLSGDELDYTITTDTNKLLTYLTSKLGGEVTTVSGVEFVQFKDKLKSILSTVKGDTTAPTLLASSPATNATNVSASTNLTLGFSEQVQAGSGSVVIKRAGASERTISISDVNQVIFAGNKVLINPAEDLDANTAYTVELASGVIQDLSGNAYAGLSGYSFTTQAAGSTVPLANQFVGLSNVKLVKDVAGNKSTVSFSITFNSASIDGQKVNGTLLDLDYDHSKVTSARVSGAQYDSAGEATPVWQFITPNMQGATANGKIVALANTDPANPIVVGGKTLDVTLGLNQAVDSFKIGFNKQTASVVTADGVDRAVGTAADVTAVPNQSYMLKASTLHWKNLAAGTAKALTDVSFVKGSQTLKSSSVGQAVFEASTDSQASMVVGKSVAESEKAAAAAAVNLTDAIAILKMIVGLNVNASGPLSPYQVVAADYNRDGGVGLTDAIDVLKAVVGLNAPAPSWVVLEQSKVASSLTMDSYNADKDKSTGWMSSTLSVDLDKTPEIQLVGVLAGDVDGSWAG